MGAQRVYQGHQRVYQGHTLDIKEYTRVIQWVLNRLPYVNRSPDRAPGSARYIRPAL